MTINESGLLFIFDENDKVVKIDDSRFYRDFFEVFDGAKSADFVFVKSEEACLIEVKNFAEHSAENRNRLIPETDRDIPLDVEAFEKFFCTISCLYGIYTKKNLTEKAAEQFELAEAFFDRNIVKGSRRLIFILFVNTDNDVFHSRTRTVKTQMNSIQQNIRKKFSWLNVKISVVNAETYNTRYFRVS